MMKRFSMVSVFSVLGLVVMMGGCADSAVCDIDVVSRVDWPPVYRPSPRTLHATVSAKGSWTPMAHGDLADVSLDGRLFTVDSSDAVYARLLVVNTTPREIGVLLHTEDVLFVGRHVLPPPGGAKLAVSEEEFAAGGPVTGLGPLPEQQVDAAVPVQAGHGVLVTVPPLASVEVYRWLEYVRRSTVGPESAVTVRTAPGVVATDGRCIERLASESSRDLQAPVASVAWPQIPLGSLTLSGHGPSRLVPSTRPNLLRPPPTVMPDASPGRTFTPIETQPAP